jgi:hypothetical protein
MKKIKKIFYVILLSLSAFILVGCDDDDDKNNRVVYSNVSFRYVYTHYDYDRISNPFYYEDPYSYAYTYYVYYPDYYDVYDVYDCGCYYDHTRVYIGGPTVAVGTRVYF